MLGGRRAGPQPPGRGYLVRPDGPDTLVQVAWAPPCAPAGNPASAPAEALPGLPAEDVAHSPAAPLKRARR